MHREVYRLRPDAHACVHTHSPYATAFAVAGLPIVTAGMAESNLIFGEIPIAPYGRAGTEAIYAHFPELLKEYNALLLGNHGVLTFAPDLSTAFSLTEAVEKTARILFLARLLGGEKALPDEELAILRGYGSQLRHQIMNAASN